LKSLSVVTDMERDRRKAQIEIEKNDDLRVEKEMKKNSDFVQHPRGGMKHFRKLIKVNPLAAQVFSFLSEYMNYKNAVVCSSRVLEEYFDVSRTSVYRAIKFLEDSGFLIIGKSGQTNIYTLNHEIVWSSYGSNKKLCAFDGKILLAESENKELSIKANRFKEIKLIENSN